MKARPILFSDPMIRALLAGRKTQTRRVVKPQPPSWIESDLPGLRALKEKPCPYGQPGDLLWCKETWAKSRDGSVLYRADTMFDSMSEGDFAWRWPRSIHMPRWASRLTLELTEVRVERVADISEEDARAEGAPYAHFEDAFEIPDCLRSIADSFPAYAHHYGFQILWESIQGPGAWDRNDWVWAIRFRVIHANVDDVIADSAGYGVTA